MPAINYSSPAAPAVSLGLRNWTDAARALPSLTGWWTLHSGRWTEETVAGLQRVTGCAPRAGEHALTRTAASLGPRPATVGGLGCADFTNGELNGLHLDQAMARDNCGLVAILGLGATAPAQDRDLIGLYGNGDAIRVRRHGGGNWNWRAGAVEGASGPFAWTEGPLLLMAERIGTTVALRLRSRTATGTVMTNTLITASVPAAIKVIFGQDEISDGHSNANPSAARSWSEYWYEAAIHAGPVLTDPGVLSFWDSYFTTVYGVA